MARRTSAGRQRLSWLLAPPIDGLGAGSRVAAVWLILGSGEL